MEGRENRDLRMIVLWSGVLLNLQMSETHILIRLLQMYFLQNGEFSSALSKLLISVEGVKPPPSPSIPLVLFMNFKLFS
jgi:hypothetical protein